MFQRHGTALAVEVLTTEKPHLHPRGHEVATEGRITEKVEFAMLKGGVGGGIGEPRRTPKRK